MGPGWPDELTMRRDHRPYYLKRADLKFQKFYARHFLKPQFDFLGQGFVFMKPWHVKIFGKGICLGNYATVIATPENKIRLSVWSDSNQGSITIGDYCLICPGVRISSAIEISIGSNCMLAGGVYITDSDWHSVYNRLDQGKQIPVKIGDNVWIGDFSIICKGVNIGANSIVGARSVVRRDIPANVIVSGNPAKIVQNLNPKIHIVKREQWFQNPIELGRAFDQFDREKLKDNSILHWLRTIIYPCQRD